MAGLLLIGAQERVVFCAPDFATLMTHFSGPLDGPERQQRRKKLSPLHSTLACPRMALSLCLGHVCNVEVGVPLGRRDEGMAEELLDVAQIGTGTEEMSGHRVPERMRCDAALDACFLSCTDDDVVDRLLPKPPATEMPAVSRAEEEGNDAGPVQKKGS